MTRNEPDSMREIHAIRAENYERTKNLSPDERNRLRSEAVLPITTQYGFRVIPKKDK